MSYAVKEIFLTLQGEGAHAGRRAVFLRFAGCNLWSGLEKDRASAICQFCDTDFIGMDGENGGRYHADALADKVAALWGENPAHRYVVLTGGEPMLQIDDALTHALHERGFTITMESNGTIAAHPAIDWVCISPKYGSDVVQQSGNELKLVWPQIGTNWQGMENWAFDHFLIQPMDDAAGNKDKVAANLAAAIEFVQQHPKWRLSMQTHKFLGLQ
ncbi:7-carboxy-7-deazaguanine synthase [Sphingorhabdus lutea]|uniref:7-carboxy-7-deazaguanine synthase n=1 Tax=Sphingorhabdus lutea TaxID=1913578 RepID=A0A1L3JE75_9SPHN|nr:7-carboxy-7-deazaguanine synthase [Sphingorhabdus lutea]APG63437.1 7-carboxy-7-deazaguanine synthase [Sphingorhabdus lutea]